MKEDRKEGFRSTGEQRAYLSLSNSWSVREEIALERGCRFSVRQFEETKEEVRNIEKTIDKVHTSHKAQWKFGAGRERWEIGPIMDVYGFGDGRWMAQEAWRMYDCDDALQQQYLMLTPH